MNRRVMRLAILLAIGAVVLTGVLAVAHAQVTNPICRNLGKYDMNGDGVMTREDMIAWKVLYLESRSETCDITLDDLSGCPKELDLDGNGRVEIEDAGAQIRVWLLCNRPPAHTLPAR